MTQKVLKVGSSAAVTIPKKSLEELGLKIGDQVSVEIDQGKGVVTIKPKNNLSAEDQKIARLTLNFINRYRKDFEALAKPNR
ncbi:MAG: AbrB/MazE/SpoVT family DNA-binding domain-containing protein [Candidatus Doudnabacteria bacterium]|nr:AbrB/MazE/SpoVT family DNA-binding domain-containing protein [Candidatus Doudnabacteria bacterium]